MRSTWGALLGLASIVFAPILPAIGQDVVIPSEAGMATYDGGTVYSGSAQVGPGGTYLYFRKDIDNGVGYREGFSTVGGFMPLLLAPNYGFFGQGQFFATDDGKFGGNVGGGYRYFVDSANRMFGAYGFLDFDESYSGNSVEQLGIGFETLGTLWDFRVNGYIPLDRDSQFVRLNALTGPPAFSGNGILLNGNAFFERSMGGADTEVGVPLLDPSFFGRLRAYFGGYAYDREDEALIGGRVRLESHINEHITVGAAFMHDDINGDMVTMAVDIRSWRESLPKLNNRSIDNKAKMFLPVVRQYRIANDRFLRNITTPALGPGGQPLNIVWVDNSNAGPGSGTFEDPFSAMPGSAPGADYILVRRGDSTLTNPVLGGITLQDGQRLFGEGFSFDITLSGTEFGPQFAGSYAITSLVPQWVVGGVYPFVSNPGGDVVTLANNNEVGGLNIVSSAGNGITGNGINNFHLFNLNVGSTSAGFGNGGLGIALTNVSGIGTIENITLHNNTAGGLQVSNTNTAPLTLTVEGSSTETPNVTGGGFGVNIFADNSQIDAEISDISNSGSGNGLFLVSQNSADLDVEVSDSSFDDATTFNGVSIIADAGAINFDLTDVTGDNAAVLGFALDVFNGATVVGTVSGTTPGGSSFSGAGAVGAQVRVDNNAVAGNSLTFINTALDDNGADGLDILVDNGSLFTVNFSDGTITGNGTDNILTDVDNGSTLTLNVDSTDLSGAGAFGYEFLVDNGSLLNADLEDVTINASGQHGVSGFVENSSTATLTLVDSLVTNSQTHGIGVSSLTGSTFNANISGTTISDNGQDLFGWAGISVVADDATVNMTLTDSTSANSIPFSPQLNALQFYALNGGLVDIDAVNTIFGNSFADGIIGEAHGVGSVGDLSLDASSSTNNDGNGVHLIVDTGATMNASVSGESTLNSNTLSGFLLDANDAGTVVNVSMTDDNQFNSNITEAGVRINATDIAEIDAIISGSAVDNDEEGIQFNIDNVADANLAVVGDGTVSNNGLDGIEFNVTNGTVITGLVTDRVSSSNNGLNGIQVNIDNSTIAATGGPLNPTVRIGGDFISQNGTHGIELNLDTVTAAADNVAIRGTTGVPFFTSTILNNGVDGIRINLLNTPLDGLQITDFDVSSNGEHGLHVDLTGSDLTNLLVADNSFEFNGDAGIEFFGDSNVQGTFDNNSVTNNGAEGMVINLENAATFTGVYTGNDFSGNDDAGLAVNAQDTSSFDITIGGPLAADANTFNNNFGPGLSVVLNDTSTGLLNVENSSFTNNFGPGIQIQQFDNSTLDGASSIIDSVFTGNTAQGIDVLVQDFATLEGMLVDGNSLSGNSGSSIRFQRFGLGNIGSLAPVVISNNSITSGGNHGISIVARNSANLDRYDLSNNTITNQFGAGVRLEHGFDAQLQVNMNGDTITGNGNNGILSLQTAGTLNTELRRLTGTWQNLLVSGNFGDGMLLGGRLGDAGALVITTSDIVNNTGVGLHVTGPGLLDANTNLIEGNGSHGIFVEQAGFKTMSFNSSIIRDNGGDGLRVVNNDNAGAFGYNITANGNLIVANANRGINVLNQGTADTTFVANLNTINTNGNEAAFFMNTSSTNQSANVGAPVLADGAVDEIPRLNLTFSGNLSQGNGNSGYNIGGAGVVLRVGTSDGSTSPTDPGGTATGGRGGVIATMDSNVFNGNAGVDVYIDSFTSTVPPAATVTTNGWTDQNEAVRNNANDTFDITTYRADPIARLDLVFTNNTGNDWDVTNPGASYSNDEPVFKSRTAAQDTAVDAPSGTGEDDPGPFTIGTRVRNAQRLAYRGTLPPTIPAGNTYLFPGVGTSSFRVQASGNVFTSGTGFILDDAPYIDPFNDAFGVDASDAVVVPPLPNLDNMPWGWSILP